jgi:hypothetical protein
MAFLYLHRIKLGKSYIPGRTRRDHRQITSLTARVKIIQGLTGWTSKWWQWRTIIPRIAAASLSGPNTSCIATKEACTLRILGMGKKSEKIAIFYKLLKKKWKLCNLSNHRMLRLTEKEMLHLRALTVASSTENFLFHVELQNKQVPRSMAV